MLIRTYVRTYVLLSLLLCCVVQSIHLKRAELEHLKEERLSQVSLDPPPQPVAKQTGAYPQDNTRQVQEGKVEGEHCMSFNRSAVQTSKLIMHSYHQLEAGH